ncbi:hypothetical protein DENSPDRAFT_879047 [Dentipellis sp. KUC8613]|nr:hypothetical protein DENSPDRAFT_879047 [Dentipellis sp. KUC8613]
MRRALAPPPLTLGRPHATFAMTPRAVAPPFPSPPLFAHDDALAAALTPPSHHTLSSPSLAPPPPRTPPLRARACPPRHLTCPDRPREPPLASRARTSPICSPATSPVAVSCLAAPSQYPVAPSAPHCARFAHCEAVLHVTPSSARPAAPSRSMGRCLISLVRPHVAVGPRAVATRAHVDVTRAVRGAGMGTRVATQVTTTTTKRD